MPGLRTRSSWLAASPLSVPPVLGALGLPGGGHPPGTGALAGARRGRGLARSILLVILCAYCFAEVLDIQTSGKPLHGVRLAGDIASVLILFALTLWISSARAARWPLPGRVALLAAMAAVTYIPVATATVAWTTMAGFFAGSVLLMLPGAIAWAAFACIVTSIFAIAEILRFPGATVAYLVASTSAVGLAVFGLARLAQLVRYVHATRAELAQLAIIKERARFARDLHDLLGYSLSAITLKAELTRRLIASNPGRARDETAEVLDIARQALADVRTVATGYRNISLSKEASSVTALLGEAGISTRVTITCGTLDEPADTVLATVLREAVTNLLRHSNARKTRIDAAIRDNTITLRIANDGITPSARSSRPGGGLENLATRLTAINGQLTAETRDGWFTVTARAPATTPAAAPQIRAAHTAGGGHSS